MPDAERRYAGKEFAMRKIRVIFSKKDRMKFVSHLDMNRFIIRLFRMAKIPVWYTEGFNQHPYISFALPLSLGFESEYEILDFKITDDSYSCKQLLDDLNSKSVPGIVFKSAFEENKKAKEIAFSEYEIKFENSNLAKSFFDYLSNAEEILADKKTKKGELNKIEISQHLNTVRYQEGECSVLITIPAGSNLNINPTLYVSAFAEDMASSCTYRVMRTLVFDKDMCVFM